MSGYLLALSLGPVQDFIAAARRTRDLWFGSYLLSEVSKAAARFLYDSGVNLIFPAPDDARSLAPDSELLVANHILAEIQNDVDPSALAEGAQAAAEKRWLEFAAAARRAVGEPAIRREIWDEQIKDVLECNAAWVPWQGKKEEYAQTRERLEFILAGRKALRDFQPARGWAGVPKSALDGTRESVFSPAVRNSSDLRRKIKVKRQEPLDAIGLVKRCAPLRGEINQEAEFVSVVRVAADPWIRRKLATPAGQRALAEIGALCHRDFAPPVNDETYRGFPYDATALYLSRLVVLKKDNDLKVHRDKLDKIAEIIIGNFGRTDQPSPYFAVLLADGDRMGATLSGITSAEAHRDFSRRLSLFARDARRIIKEHHGCLVYSGGDDVLAFVPVEQCLSAARELHDDFGQKMSDAVKQLGHSRAPTLSVGIAIGHCYEPLEDLLNAARAAERAAKAGSSSADERNGLAVHFSTRGSDAITLRGRWDHKVDERLARWIDLLRNNKLSKRTIYDLHFLAGEYAHGWSDTSLPDLLRQEAARVLRKKQVSGQALPAEVVTLILSAINSSGDLAHIPQELLVASHMAAVYGKGGENE